MHAALTAHDTYYILIIYYTVHLGWVSEWVSEWVSDQSK
jgi:hypothetical protein